MISAESERTLVARYLEACNLLYERAEGDRKKLHLEEFEADGQETVLGETEVYFDLVAGHAIRFSERKYEVQSEGKADILKARKDSRPIIRSWLLKNYSRYPSFSEYIEKVDYLALLLVHVV